MPVVKHTVYYTHVQAEPIKPTSTIVDARHQMLEARAKLYTQEISTETKLKETFPYVHTCTCRFYTMGLIKTNTHTDSDIQHTHTHNMGHFR